MDLSQLFESAAADSKNLPSKPDNETLLQLYSLYKQGTEGDIRGDAPNSSNFVGMAKYNAWSALKGKSSEDAMQEYIDLVEQLKG